MHAEPIFPCFPYSSCEENLVVEAASNEMDPQLEEDLNRFYDPAMDLGDYKIFSPLHSQIHAELGPSNFGYPATNISNCHDGLQFQYGTNEHDAYISDFLDSVLNNSYENSCEESDSQTNLIIESETPKRINVLSRDKFVKESGSCSESDSEVAQIQFDDPEGEGYGFSEVMVDERDYLQMDTNRSSNRTPFDQNNDKLWNSNSSLPADSFTPAIFSLQAAGQCYNPFNESNSHTDSVGSGNAYGTGIRIRTRQPQVQPYNQDFMAQGTASRRLRLQMDPDVGPPAYCCKLEDLNFKPDNDVKPLVAKVGATEKYADNGGGLGLAIPGKVHFAQNSGLSSSESKENNFARDGSKWVPSVLSNARVVHHWIGSPLRRLRVIIVIVMFVFFVGIWSCFKI